MIACALAMVLSLFLGNDDRQGVTNMVVDFGSGAAPWRSIDDVVMGGRSWSRMVVEGGVARFEGELSLANNGGFASVRSAVAEHDLGGFDGVLLRLRGDGNTYGIRLRTTAAFDGVSYQAEIAPPAGQWVEVAVPFADFAPVFRGRRVADHPPLDPADIRSFGLIIARRQAGSFALDLAWIVGWKRSRGAVGSG